MQTLTPKNAPGRFGRGDPKAGEWVYKEFKHYVFTLVTDLTNQSEDAWDLVHDIFSKLFQENGKYPTRDSIRSMLNQIGKGVCSNYLKKKRRTIDKTVEFIEDSMVPDDGIFEQSEYKAAFHDLLYVAVRNLPEKKRTFFILFYVDDLSNSQIAERLGISVQTVANRKSMILQMLKMEIRKTGGNEILELSFLLLIFIYDTH